MKKVLLWKKIRKQKSNGLLEEVDNGDNITYGRIQDQKYSRTYILYVDEYYICLVCALIIILASIN